MAAFEAKGVKFIEARPKLSATKCSPGSRVLAIYGWPIIAPRWGHRALSLR